MYLVIEETTYEYVTPSYHVKSQDESFSNAQKKKEALSHYAVFFILTGNAQT